MEALFREQLALKAHLVGEQVAVEGRIGVEQLVKVEMLLGRGEVVEPYLGWRDVRPVGLSQTMRGVRLFLTNAPEDHCTSLDSRSSTQQMAPRRIAAKSVLGASGHEKTPRAPDRDHLPLLHSCPGGVGRCAAARGAGNQLTRPCASLIGPVRPARFD